MPPARSPRPTVGRVGLIAAALLPVVLVGVVAFSVGRLSTLADPPPASTSAEAGFARDMQVHHNQGVELALIVRDRTDDEAVRLLAYDIAVTQGQQSGQLYGWLTAWDLSQAGSEPSMTWMSRPGTSGDNHSSAHTAGLPTAMPGLATSAQIARLSAATGVEAEREFLTLMIAHHEGAIEMADSVLDRSSNSTVHAFATGVITSQKAEIDLMTRMLADRT